METVSLNSITAEIASSLKRELDEPFKRMLAAKVDAWRSRLIRNSLQTKPSESKFFRQTIYIPMEQGSPIPDCIGAPTTCDMSISTKILPVPLRFGVSLFSFIGSVDSKEPFYEAPPGTIEYLQAGKYSGDTVFYTYELERLQVHGMPNLPAVKATGIFDSPSAVMEFNCENSGVGCDFWNLAYPVTGDVKQMIVQGILEKDYAQPTEVPDGKEVEV